MNKTTPNHIESVVHATQQWVESLVVAENLCPFAKRELDASRVRFQVIFPQPDADFVELVLAQLVNEIHLLESSEIPATTLLILPSQVEDFDHYLDLLSMVNTLLDDMGHEGVIQIASFHPEYLFDGEDIDSPSHFTNRSPYPMLHLLREKDVALALQNYPNPEEIPERNMARMQELGSDYLKALLQSCVKPV